MVEEEKIFDSKIKSKGIFNFKDFYQFSYDWLSDDTNLLISEDKYSEKISERGKLIEIEWTGKRNVTDYFRFVVKVKIKIDDMVDVEIQEGDLKIKTNKGIAEMKVTGILQRDWQGRFERTAFQKFLRGIYEKWVITARIDKMETELIIDLEEFLAQVKAYLDLKGKR